jgi:23S rRNA (uridine2479-2'-O)-methyltransferase
MKIESKVMKTNILKISTENSEFQQIQALRDNRTKRNKRGEFFVEGVRAINHAVNNHWEITSLIFTREKRLSTWAEEIIGKSNATKLIEMSLRLLKEISQKDETSELIALMKMPADDLSRIPERKDTLVVVLDRPINPRNIGTIIRSCDALKADGLIISGHCADIYDPETIRATTGSFFCVPIVRLPSHKELVPWMKQLKKHNSKLQIIGTSEDSPIYIQEHDFTLPTILLAGNETHGLSESYKSLCDAMVAIPMYGSASSLNLACATSIVLYEIDRQRKDQKNGIVIKSNFH